MLETARDRETSFAVRAGNPLYSHPMPRHRNRPLCVLRFCLPLLSVLWFARPARAAEPATNGEAAWMPLSQAAALLGMAAPVPLPDGCLLSNATHAVRFSAGHRSAVMDGVNVWLHLPPREAASNDLRDIAAADYATLLQPLLSATSAAPSRLRIALDAGHGGEDTGASSARPAVHEKEITLDIAQHVARKLSAAGHHVLQTRPRDTYEPLGERVRAAAARQAQLFVSIHANSAPSNHLATGIETYILPAAGFTGTGDTFHGLTNACPGNRFDARNALLGFALQRQCAPLAAMDRGLKHARYFVLKESPCPAALVECGFLTNTNDAARLGDAAYRRHLADAIAAGLLDYARLQLPDAPTTNRPPISGH